MNRRIGTLWILIGLLSSLSYAQSWRGAEAVALQVHDAKGRAVPDARVIFTFQGIPGELGPDIVATDTKGRAVVAELAPGPWQVEVIHQDYLSFIAMVDVRRDKKPLITASFLEAGGRSLNPVKVKISKGDERQASPVLEARAPAAPPKPEVSIAQEPPSPPVQVAEAPPPETPTVDAPSPAPEPVLEIETEAAISPPVGEEDLIPETEPEFVEEPQAEPAMESPAPEPETPKIDTPSPAPEPQAVPAPPTPAPSETAPEIAEEPQAETVMESPVPEPETPKVDMPSPAPETPPEVEAPIVPSPAEVPQPTVESKPTPPPVPAATAPSPPAVAVSALAAPADPGILVTSRRDGSCPDCETAEWTLQVSAPVPAVGLGSGGSCDSGVLDAAQPAMQELASSIQLELQGFIGPIANGTEQAAIRHAESDMVAPFQGPLAAFVGGASPCQIVGLVLPKEVRFSRVTYAASDQQGSGDCAPGQICSIGDAAWLGSRVERGPSTTVIYGLFENRSSERARRAFLTAYYRPPSARWQPRLPAAD